MKAQSKDLGRLVSVHGMSPAYRQQAVFIIILSFLFFLSTIVAFYMFGRFLFFLLASGFLMVYLISLISFLMQRRFSVRTYEKGIEYRSFSNRWEDLEVVKWKTDRRSRILEMVNSDGACIVIPASIHEIERLANIIAERTNRPVS
jgi:hypothetical protein